MGIFQSITGDIRQRLQERADAKAEEKRALARMRLEAKEVERAEFEKQFKVNAALVAQRNAFERAQKESGINKLRALNQSMHMGEQKEHSVFDRLKEHTQRNLAKRQENLARTRALRSEAEKMKTKDSPQTRSFGLMTGNTTVVRRKPFANYKG